MKIPQFLKRIYFRYFFHVKKGKCLFVPHPGFCKLDKASVINYKADNCLIFVRYLLEHELCFDKELVVVSTTSERALKEQAWCREHFPKANVRIVPNISKPIKKAWASAEYVFESEERFPYRKKKGQKYISLSYYPISLKNDYFDPSKESVYKDRIKFASEIDWISSSSLINTQIDSACFSLSMSKFKAVGKCRSDELLKIENLSYVRSALQKQTGDYKFSKIALYTPTHRDYEKTDFDIKRSILGFDVNKTRFEKFLHDNQLLIVCKLHPLQNAEIIDTDLPRGVINFSGADNFGLIELMKISDMLITDYTSTYVDYMLLNKPVLFNLYDLDVYSKTRGLAFSPYKMICAGEVFMDEKSFYEAMNETLAHPDKWKDKREVLCEYLNTYHTDVCEKTYKAIFKKWNKV